MQFFSAISEEPSSDDAAARVIADLREHGLAGVDLAFVFLTAHHRQSAEAIVEKLWLELDAQTMVGCSGEGVIGGDREIEREPGLAVLAGLMPGVRVHPFHIAGETDWRHLLTDSDALAERIGHGPESHAAIAFGDPFSTPVNQWMTALDDLSPPLPLIGGMASSARSAGENVLIRNDQVYDEGLVGVSVSGPVEVESVVSQGCRPIGKPMVITRAHDNVIEQLGGKPALSALRELVDAMDAQQRQQLSSGLFLGRAISEYREQFGRGDFLVRNIIGVDENAGAIGLADRVKTGQTVQFHVRDAETAGDDLAELLRSQKTSATAAGGLLFSCNGRGTRMFSVPCHDISAARGAMPATPVAGFFAAGEFGPVGGKNFIHGHTASFALFRDKP
jgi:small ligand-binding sensory domain FIST